MRRHLTSGEDEYYERAVAISYIGALPRLFLAMRWVLSGESEVGAAMRSLLMESKWGHALSMAVGV